MEKKLVSWIADSYKDDKVSMVFKTIIVSIVVR